MPTHVRLGDTRLYITHVVATILFRLNLYTQHAYLRLHVVCELLR